MAKAFVSRSQATQYLRGHRKPAILIQVICTCAEIFVMIAEGVCLFQFPKIPLFPLVLLLDLLLLSPLKVGRALFYETLVTYKQEAKIILLFRYFHDGYARSIHWRLHLWIRRFGWQIVLCIPSAFFLYISKTAEQIGSETFLMIAFAFSLLFLLISLIITEILMFRYIPAMYLLSKVKSANHALLVARRISKGETGNWTALYLDYAGWSFSFIFILPFFYVSPVFYTARAIAYKQLFSGILPKNHEEHLQHKGNHGRIRNEF